MTVEQNEMGKDEDERENSTTVVDWFGAAKVWPEDRWMERKRGPVVFHIFRPSSKRNLFAITAGDDTAALPPCPGGGRWELFKRIPETGQARVGFSEAEAKADIERQGYHLAGARDSLTGAAVRPHNKNESRHRIALS